MASFTYDITGKERALQIPVIQGSNNKPSCAVNKPLSGKQCKHGCVTDSTNSKGKKQATVFLTSVQDCSNYRECSASEVFGFLCWLGKNCGLVLAARLQIIINNDLNAKEKDLSKMCLQNLQNIIEGLRWRTGVINYWHITNIIEDMPDFFFVSYFPYVVRYPYMFDWEITFSLYCALIVQNFNVIHRAVENVSIHYAWYIIFDKLNMYWISWSLVIV